MCVVHSIMQHTTFIFTHISALCSRAYNIQKVTLHFSVMSAYVIMEAALLYVTQCISHVHGAYIKLADVANAFHVTGFLAYTFYAR